MTESPKPTPDAEAVHLLGAILASMILGAPETIETVPQWALDHAEVLHRKLKKAGIALMKPQEGTR